MVAAPHLLIRGSSYKRGVQVCTIENAERLQRLMGGLIANTADDTSFLGLRFGLLGFIFLVALLRQIAQLFEIRIFGFEFAQQLLKAVFRMGLTGSGCGLLHATPRYQPYQIAVATLPVRAPTAVPTCMQLILMYGQATTCKKNKAGFEEFRYRALKHFALTASGVRSCLIADHGTLFTMCITDAYDDGEGACSSCSICG